ncbi:MAG: hypothetical protein ACJAZN_002761 [Planctomycetota bacterium]|jgi:hypothetical protein
MGLMRAVEAFGELKILVAQDADFTGSNPSSTVLNHRGSGVSP